MIDISTHEKTIEWQHEHMILVLSMNEVRMLINGLVVLLDEDCDHPQEINSLYDSLISSRHHFIDRHHVTP